MKTRRRPSDRDPFATGFIVSCSIDRTAIGGPSEFPWSIPALRNTRELPLHPKVTFFVGENGSGKSTLLEALAQRAGFDLQGGSKNFSAVDRDYWTTLAFALLLQRGVRREKDAFFLRAESFFNVASRVDELAEPDPRILRYYGGRSPHAQSHGESFLALAANRWSGEGLYLLDEPEAALSPFRQLALLRIIPAQVSELGSQFVIATHSPILMAYPEALIYQFTPEGITPIEYEETEHFTLTRDFLMNRQHYLSHVLADSAD